MLTTREHVVNRRRSESGAVLVEFSFVLLPTMGFIFLIMALAWVIFAWACVQEGVREAARVAVTCPSPLNSTIQQTVINNSYGFVNAGNVKGVFAVKYLDSTTLAAVTGQVSTGDVVQVQVTGVPVSTFAPILHDSYLLKVGASAADIMSCAAPVSIP